MDFDFSRLFTRAETTETVTIEPVKQADIDIILKDFTVITEEVSTPFTADFTGLQSLRAVKEKRKREIGDRQYYAEVCQTYQNNIKETNQIQTDIIKGLQAGADLPGLLLKACEAISKTTGNTLFYEKVEAELLSIYGIALHNVEPLQIELEHIQNRLNRLQVAVSLDCNQEHRQNIQQAIDRHKAREQEIITLLGTIAKEKRPA